MKIRTLVFFSIVILTSLLAACRGTEQNNNTRTVQVTVIPTVNQPYIVLRATAIPTDVVPSEPFEIVPPDIFLRFPVLVAKKDVNCRTSPTRNADNILAHVPYNSKLEVTGQNTSGNWLHVCCVQSQECWIREKLVRTVPSPEPTLRLHPTPIPQDPGCPNGCDWHKPGCDIKGNISFNTGEKIFHMPGDKYYWKTKINSRYGERWFCTPAEARRIGWRRTYR